MRLKFFWFTTLSGDNSFIDILVRLFSCCDAISMEDSVVKECPALNCVNQILSFVSHYSARTMITTILTRDQVYASN